MGLLLLLAQHDAAEDLVFVHELFAFGDVRGAGRLHLGELLARIRELALQVEHLALVIRALRLCGDELLLGVEHLLLESGDHHVLLLTLDLELPDVLLGLAKFGHQLGVLGDERIHTLLRVLHALDLFHGVVALHSHGGELCLDLGQPVEHLFLLLLRLIEFHLDGGDLSRHVGAGFLRGVPFIGEQLDLALRRLEPVVELRAVFALSLSIDLDLAELLLHRVEIGAQQLCSFAFLVAAGDCFHERLLADIGAFLQHLLLLFRALARLHRLFEFLCQPRFVRHRGLEFFLRSGEIVLEPIHPLLDLLDRVARATFIPPPARARHPLRRWRYCCHLGGRGEDEP